MDFLVCNLYASHRFDTLKGFEFIRTQFLLRLVATMHIYVNMGSEGKVIGEAPLRRGWGGGVLFSVYLVSVDNNQSKRVFI